MAFAILTALVVAGAPQGVSVQVQQLTAEGVSKADAQLVMQACADELAGQGYPIVKAGDERAKPMAVISGSVRKKSDAYLVTLTLTRAADQLVLDEAKLEVAAGALKQAGVDGAKRLATEIRMTWGVRAKLKL